MSRSRRSSCGRARLGSLSLLLGGVAAMQVALPAPALAQGNPPLVHPIYAHLQDAPQNDLAVQRFSAATRRFGLGPVEVVDVEGDRLPPTADRLRMGMELTRRLDFTGAMAALEEAVAQVATTGGAGVDAAALSDLFVYRAWAGARLDFNSEHVPAATARAQGYAELVRAAMLTPARQFNQQQFPPVLLEDWARAVADVRARPQGTLLVHAAPEALVTCDGGASLPGPATFVGLAQGEHLLRIDEPGWASWGGTIAVNGPTMEISVPPRRPLTLDDAEAAARARRMGAKFALVAEPLPGRDGGLSLGMHLVDAAGIRHDAVIQPLAGDPGGLDAAVMRLDEQARTLDRTGVAPLGPPPSGYASSTGTGTGAGDPSAAALPPPVLLPPPPAPVRFADDPAAWSRDHWPLLTAVGILVTTALILSVTVGR
ncbi:MAG: hypothetical protein ABI560_04890 [Myxococcales bacterium]